MCGCGRTSTPLPGSELRRTHVIEEDERPDHLVRMARQQAAHLEAAEILGVRLEQVTAAMVAMFQCLVFSVPSESRT